MEAHRDLCGVCLEMKTSSLLFISQENSAPTVRGIHVLIQSILLILSNFLCALGVSVVSLRYVSQF